MVNRAGVIEFGTSYGGVNPDVFYVVGRPKGDAGLLKVLGAVGNALADENGLPKPGSKVGATETGLELVGCPMYNGTSSYIEIVKNAERLKKGAGMGGLWVDFEFDGKSGSIVKTEVMKRKKLSRLAEEVTKSHHFKVNGYASHRYPLPRNIDLLAKDENVGKVKAAIEENGREKTLYSLLDEFMSYSQDPKAQSNTEKVFGLGDDKLYTGLKGLLKEEVNGKHEELNGSKIAELSDSKWRVLRFIGSKYREHVVGEIEELRTKREKQIDALRGRFSEPYKTMRLSSFQIQNNWRAEGHPPWADAV